MAARALVLCENTVSGNTGAVAEHGWSAWLETPAGSFLFDTGFGNTLTNNAAHFKVPLQDAQAILISHHHSDHTGGLLTALRAIRNEPERPSVPVYAHPDLFKDSFYNRKGKLGFVGLPHKRGALEMAGADFRLDTGWREIASGVYMTGEVPRRTAYEVGDPNTRHYDDTEQVVFDPIRDDQTVVIDTPAGLFVILGCAHAGLVNILMHISEQTGTSRFHTIIGGTHLGGVPADQVEQTISALREFDIGRIGVSHCTGQKIAARLLNEFDDRFFFCSVGTVVEV
jgi:7,8-dihydropterin-6-yl-methyl-4-(beta-D-ribofuranosyl)aminobenzene 5'-phosphate synthase